jgi:D-alanine-D-alanine ligase
MEFDKGQAKALMLARGLATADFFVASPGDFADGKNLPLPYPLFVKPLYESDSRGIDAKSAVFNHSQYIGKIAQIARDFPQPS